MVENSVKYMPPDGFFGIQTLQNSISDGSQPPDPTGGAYDAPQSP